MTIQVEIIADSISETDVRITTFLLTYPRFIHAEVLTHRVFSRNSASSRAIPITKMLHSVLDTPALPIHWGKNQKGMQAKRQLDGWRLRCAKMLWNIHRWHSVGIVWTLNKLGLHKQLANRLLETHSHITVLVTSTQWKNFFHLRAHSDAMPEVDDLARKMQYWYTESLPKLKGKDEWHLPFITSVDMADPFVTLNPETSRKKLQLISVARCARTSYTLFEHNVFSCEEDYTLGKRLVAARPLHASPLEHQATPDPLEKERYLWGNFHGWVQHRKLYSEEAVSEVSSYRSRTDSVSGSDEVVQSEE